MQVPYIRPCLLVPGLLFLALTVPKASRAEPGNPDDSVSKTTVFQLGEGHNSKFAFRIPAITVTKTGTLLALCERRVGLHDHAQNDIVLRRSHDGGATWDPMQIVAEEGGDSLNDPCVVVLDSGRILLRYTRFPKGVHARNSAHTVIADSGYGGPKNVRVYLTHSDDDGESWSRPRELTRAMRPESAISLGSPGVGLQLSRGKHSGRILLPNYEVYHLGDGKRNSVNSVSYSDDGGQTWHLSSKIAEPGPGGFGNEAQLAELSGNRVLLSARDQDGGTSRKISVSDDGGLTWSMHRIAADLLTPQCMSSVLCYPTSDDAEQSVLFHSLPLTKDSRTNGAIMISRDNGESWKKAAVIEPGDFAYSCLTHLPNGDVGCLYETDDYHRIVFVRIPIELLGI